MIGVGTRVKYLGPDESVRGMVGEVIATNVLGSPTAISVAFEGRFLHLTTSTRHVVLA